MSTVIENAHGKDSYNKRLVIKGASELILKSCKSYMNERGEICNLDDNTRQQVLTIIDTYAKAALRTIALAYRDLEPGLHGVKHDEPDGVEIKDVETDNLTLVSVLGIYDIIRTEVPGAVDTC
jgi:Ca2+-transporting ATPase